LLSRRIYVSRDFHNQLLLFAYKKFVGWLVNGVAACLLRGTNWGFMCIADESLSFKRFRLKTIQLSTAESFPRSLYSPRPSVSPVHFIQPEG